MSRIKKTKALSCTSSVEEKNDTNTASNMFPETTSKLLQGAFTSQNCNRLNLPRASQLVAGGEERVVCDSRFGLATTKR